MENEQWYCRIREIEAEATNLAQMVRNYQRRAKRAFTKLNKAERQAAQLDRRLFPEKYIQRETHIQR